jgi:HPt (histidine-containing phosphotransfer) domain-containing protein
MTTMRSVAAVALTVLAGWTPLRAQEPEASSGRTAVVRAEQPADCEGGPVAVVAQFLGMTPDQRTVLEQALREREQTLGPILQEIALREQRISELIASGGSPAEIGVLVIQIHQLRQAAEAAQAVFLASVESLLAAEQRVLWEQVRLAARLKPVLPAFQALRML